MPTANKQVTKVNNYAPPQEGDLLEEFERTHKSYIAFKEKGIHKIPDVDANGNPTTKMARLLDDGLFRRIRIFLNNVDLSKGPIERKVTRLERRRSMNPVTHKMEDNLVVHVAWIAKDFLGNTIEHSDFREGLYNLPLTTTTIVNGKKQVNYSNWQAVYDIPFSKETVDEALDNQINPPELVNYFVRVSQATRDGSFSLEQFRDSTFEECQEISKQGKGLNR